MILKLIAGLRILENRDRASTQLANYLGAQGLIIFINDPIVKMLLPAPGFPQTLPNGQQWDDFLAKVMDNEEYQQEMPSPFDGILVNTVGVSFGNEAVAVLWGGNLTNEVVEPLKQLLPVLYSIFSLEQEIISARNMVSIAQSSAIKAARLTKTIDQIRINLKDALVKQEKDRKEIEDLLRKKDEFLNIASHELRTPLTSMKAYMQILQKRMTGVDNTVTLDFLKKANVQMDKLTLLINDLLDVSKIQAGQLMFTFSRFNFHDLMVETVTQFRAISSHQIILNSSQALYITADRNRLEQVMNNLLSNAIKYSPNAGRVMVDSVVDQDCLYVRVQDFGIGIPEQESPYIFDRFFRVKEIAGKFSGLGLGLHITKEIIERHAGCIGVESRQGEGSIFWFKIPINEKEGNVICT